jgi:hypothetical protein
MVLTSGFIPLLAVTWDTHDKDKEKYLLLNEIPDLEFLKSLCGLRTDEELDYRTGPPGYIGWRNSFLDV